MEWFTSIPEAWLAVIAGALGGCVRWMAVREKIKDGLISIAIGGISSPYLSHGFGPMLQYVFGSINISGMGTQPASFLIGLCGVTLIGFIIDVVNYSRLKLGDKNGPKP